MNIPKAKIQEQMDYFSRQFEHRGEAGWMLAWVMLKDWVDHYDVPELEPEEPKHSGSLLGGANWVQK